MTPGPLHVVAHEATRTGAPLVLLELLRYAEGRIGRPMTVELLRGGPLAEQLLSFGGVAGLALPAAVLVNGSVAAEAIDRVPAGVPTAIYVHEDGQSLDALSGQALAAIGRYSVVICVSNRAAHDLRVRGVTEERLVVLPPALSFSAPDTSAVEGARRELIHDGELLVVGCGEAGWRKGADLFLHVAQRVAARSDARFAWIGARPRGFSRVLDHDASQLGLDDRLRWLGELEEVGPVLGAADVLITPTRRDARPLVPLEAAVAGTPTVAFAIGGVKDLAAEGAIEAVPFPDTSELARTALDMVEDADRSERLVRNARRLAAEQSIDSIGPRFVELVRALTVSATNRTEYIGERPCP